MTLRHDPSGAAALAARQLALFPTSQSYGPYGLTVNRPEPNKAEPPAPLTPADVALWPDWTECSVDALDLDAFDDAGRLVGEGGAE